MKLAYSANAYRRFSVEAAIDRVAALGYSGIELMADMPHLWPLAAGDGEIDGIRARRRENGLSISNVNAFMMTGADDGGREGPARNSRHDQQSAIADRQSPSDFWRPSWIEPDPDYRKLRVAHTIASLRIAKKLGASCITTEPGGPLPAGMSREQAMDLFVQGLGEALRTAEDEGVLLLVEPEPDLLIENAAQFRDLAARMDSPMFGLNFDVGHFFCVSDPLPETIRSLAEWTRHYHFEDIAATRVHHHLVPGHGAIDFDAVLGAIVETGYDGWLTVELYPYLEDPDAAGREARAFLQRRMPT